MKVTVKSRSEADLESYDYRDACEIYVNGKEEFGVHDGEPEDSNLSRDFNEVWSIPTLMSLAYEAGKAGETFEVEYEDIED